MTIEEILNEALKYGTRTAFQKGNRKAYRAAKKLGIYERAVAHMKVICRIWSDQELVEEALKYETRNEFNKGSPSAYQIATQRKILDLICSHMPIRINISGKNNPNYKWSDENLAQIALKYNFRKDFAAEESGAYQMANDRGILNEICKHMKRGSIGENNSNYKYTDKVIKERALPFQNPGEFKKNYPILYATARRRGILSEVCSHMRYLCHRPYTETELVKLASLCGTKRDFSKKYNGAYQAALKMDIIDKITAHMPRSKSISYMEEELFLIIKEIYPSTKRLADYKVRIPSKPYIKRFHLDIYVPELKLAIEFDGKYWHSFERLRNPKHRVEWTDDDIRNYHKIKDKWFLSAHKIRVLHIKEDDWRKNKESCIQKCLVFLKSYDSTG